MESKSYTARFKRFKNRNKKRLSKALYLELISRTYSVSWFRNIVKHFFKSRKPKKWLFIVGCFNSGTTILRELLATHPDVAGLPREGIRFTDVLKRPDDIGWTRNWTRCEDHIKLPDEVSPEMANDLIKDWSPVWKRSASVYMEKSIPNIVNMPWFDKNFDEVYFLGIMREPYCVCEGMKRRAKPKFPATKELGRDEYTYTDVAEQWVIANERLLENRTKVKNYWGITYEELAIDPIKYLKEICTFLGIEQPEIEEKGEEMIVNGRSFTIKNMNQNSINRLSEEDKKEIDQVVLSTQFDHPYKTRTINFNK